MNPPAWLLDACYRIAANHPGDLPDPRLLAASLWGAITLAMLAEVCLVLVLGVRTQWRAVSAWLSQWSVHHYQHEVQSPLASQDGVPEGYRVTDGQWEHEVRDPHPPFKRTGWKACERPPHPGLTLIQGEKRTHLGMFHR